jgi:hypothetical protein
MDSIQTIQIEQSSSLGHNDSDNENMSNNPSEDVNLEVAASCLRTSTLFNCDVCSRVNQHLNVRNS